MRCNDRFKLIMEAIWELLNKDWTIYLRHVLREGNKCTNFLANSGYNGFPSLAWNIQPLTDLQSIILQDMLRGLNPISAT